MDYVELMYKSDEPFANPNDILRVADQMENGDHSEVVNGMSPITNPADFHDETIPKVIAILGWSFEVYE